MCRSGRALERTFIYLVGAVAGAAIGSAVHLQPERHEAQVDLLISALPSVTSGDSDLASRAYLSQNRAETYARVVTSRQVLEPVIQTVGLDTNVNTLARTIDVSIPYDTSVLSVVITNDDPVLAIEIAGAIADRAPEVLGELEKEDREAPSRVKVLPLGDPEIIRTAGTSTPWLVPSATGLLGIAGAAGLDRHLRLRRRAHLVADTQSVLSGLPILGYLSSEPEAPVGAGLKTRLSRLPGPLAVVGATRQVAPEPVAETLGTELRNRGPSAVLDLSDNQLDGPSLRAKVASIHRDSGATLITGPPLPVLDKSDALLLAASAVLLVIPARDALVNDLHRSFDIVARSRVPVLGAVLVDHIHSGDRRPED